MRANLNLSQNMNLAANLAGNIKVFSENMGHSESIKIVIRGPVTH